MSEVTPPRATPEASASGSKHPADHVNLRVTYLIAGNPRPPHDLGSVPASTTVADLKARLQQELLEHPLPHEQRLIYQGRPLMQSNATLRDALRIEGPIGPLPYTVHIIISPRPASSHFRPSPPAPTSQLEPPNNGQPPNALSNPQNALDQAHRLQALAQQQLTEMQNQLAMLNPQLNQAMGNMPYNVNATIRIQNGPMQLPHHLPNPHHHHHHHLPQPPPFPPNPINTNHTIPGQQASGPVPNALPNPPSQLNRSHMTLPTQQPPSSLHTDLHTEHLAAHRHAHGLGMPRPYSTDGNPPTRSTLPDPPLPSGHAQAPSMSRTSQPFGPIPLSLPFPLFQNSILPHTQPTVWLTSSQHGPEALLFAPGHGYYTTAPTAPATLTNLLSPSATFPAAESLLQPPGSAPHATPTATTQPPQAPNPAHAQPAQAPNLNGPVPAARRGRNGNAENDDIFGFIIQRAWLFIRLYMFMFVLSEPGTWRRYLLLFMAVVVCLLPRRNPLNQAFAAARRHIDNLIGPPHPQPRDRLALRGRDANDAGIEGARARLDAAVERGRRALPPHEAREGNAAGAAGPSNSQPRLQPSGAVVPTPEETARRLVRDNEQRNPVIQVLYRLEQAVALFLASLIPGVGERHVAAREDVRREDERIRLEEQTRREAEEQKRQEDLQKSNEGAASEPASSSEMSAGPSSEDKGKGKEIAGRTQTNVDDRAPNLAGTGTGTGDGAQMGSSSALDVRPGGEDAVRARFT